MSGYKVYDRDFGTVGSVPQPPKGVRAAQMSPDGRRAYILTYAVEPGDATLPSVHWSASNFMTSIARKR